VTFMLSSADHSFSIEVRSTAKPFLSSFHFNMSAEVARPSASKARVLKCGRKILVIRLGNRDLWHNHITRRRDVGCSQLTGTNAGVFRFDHRALRTDPV
jgi:hypothetical protein